MGRVAGLTAEGTRTRVLEAAARVFADCGFEGARMTRIAEAAGLSVGAIYNHYESKGELLAAVVECHTAESIGHLLETPGAAGVVDFLAARAATLDQGPPAALLLAEMILIARRDPDVAEVLLREVAEREALIRDFVGVGQTAGDVTSDVDPAVVARFSLMLLLGSVMVRALGLPSTDADAWASFTSRLLDGIRDKENK